jgi:hypothetical protein
MEVFGGFFLLKIVSPLGVVVYTYNLSYSGGRGKRITSSRLA